MELDRWMKLCFNRCSHRLVSKRANYLFRPTILTVHLRNTIQTIFPNFKYGLLDGSDDGGRRL